MGGGHLTNIVTPLPGTYLTAKWLPCGWPFVHQLLVVWSSETKFWWYAGRCFVQLFLYNYYFIVAVHILSLYVCFTCLLVILQSTAIELPDVQVRSLSLEVYVGLTETLTLQVATSAVPEGANVIEVQITDDKMKSLDWGVEDHKDGTYSIIYTPESVGQLQLAIKVGPFSLGVRQNIL